MSTGAIAGLESTARPISRGRARFPLFDGFRAVAAISVLVTHVAYLSGFSPRSPLGAFTARLDVGVAVFFVISGFLLYRPYVAARLEEQPSPRVSGYLWRRFLRIFPAYWLALTVTVFVLHVPAHTPGAKDLFLYYDLLHLYSLGNVVGPILSSYTLVTEVAFYVFLPLYVFAVSGLLARGAATAPRQVRRELVALAGLFVLGVVYRVLVTSADFNPTRAGQLQNVLPGWIDAFAVGMLLAVVSAWIAHSGRRAPLRLDRRWAPAASWALAAAAFVVLSLWIGRPPRGKVFYTFWQDMGIHYFYVAIGLFFLLPGIFGNQRTGGIRKFLRMPAVQFLGLVSYGLYLWNETWLEKFVQWTGRDNPVFPKPTPFWEMFAAVLALSFAAAVASYLLVERPAMLLKDRLPFLRSRERTPT